MGTSKRERQKANRALRQQEQERQAKTAKVKRNALLWSIVAVLAVGIVVLIAWVGGAFDGGGDDNNNSGGTADTAAIDTKTAGTATADAGTAAAGAFECPPADGSAEPRQQFDAAPQMCIDPTATYTATVVTNHGELTIELDAERAPITVDNFVSLARYHYFDGTQCHRAIPGFMVQCGDPTATGTGGPGYEIEDELPEAGEYQIGSVAMANSSAPDTGGSQFFLITGQQGVNLPPNYSLFGQVTDGLDTTLPALDALGNDDPTSNGVPPLEPIEIESITITES